MWFLMYLVVALTLAAVTMQASFVVVYSTPYNVEQKGNPSEEGRITASLIR